MYFIVGFVDLVVIKKNLYLEGWCYNRTLEKIPLYFKIIYQKKILKKKIVRFKRYDVAKNINRNKNIKFGFKITVIDKMDFKNFNLNKLKIFVGSKNYKVRLTLSK